jgi:hypothetical protein
MSVEILKCLECGAHRGRTIVRVIMTDKIESSKFKVSVADQLRLIKGKNIGDFETVCLVCGKDKRVTHKDMFIGNVHLDPSVIIDEVEK